MSERFPAPDGYRRLELPRGHFGRWSRGLPVLPGRGQVLLFDGRPKARQSAQAAVLDVDVGRRDLQQCADLAIRLHAEHLRALGRAPCFRFTSGHRARWTDWAAGARPQIRGSRVRWQPDAAAPSESYASFRGYLRTVFSYAGTASLHRDSRPIAWADAEPGDVFVEPGFPGHLVIVLDVAAKDDERLLLLAQSYMPAQSPHVLRGPIDGAWYPKPTGPLETPEWHFETPRPRRLELGCGSPS